MPAWYQQDPEEISLEQANVILSDPQSKLDFPNQFRALLNTVQDKIGEVRKEAEEQNRLSFIQPSYEQALKLNAWIWGIDYIVDFDANRIGKTTGGVINCLLWELPDDPEWVMFRPHTDHLNRTYKVLRRPPISAVREIRQFLADANPPLYFDPTKQYDDPINLEAYNEVARFINSHFKKFKPNLLKRMIWAGGPDKDWLTKEILLPEFVKWLPRHVTESVSVYDCRISLRFRNKKGQRCHTQILFKSYDSEDTKWSGSAVDGIILSEGVPKGVFNEVRQRYKYPAYGSWDYTPYEPRNTAGKSALAHSVYKDPTKLPLAPFIFSGFGIKDAPTYILSDDKRADLIKNWKDDPQGDARIKGIFYSSSPVVLKHYDPQIHALTISLDDLRRRYAPKSLILFRGIDPGWGHVTSCAWMALAPDNTKYIYKFYSRSQRSIEERCDDIITMSGNKRIRHPKHPAIWQESVDNPRNNIRISYIDHHTFKTDEVTKRPFSYNYINNGLIVRPSITYGPKERATLFNGLLQPLAHLPHPQTHKPPGSRLYFLINEEGVAEAVNKMSNLFWLAFEKGEKRGLTKDTVQDYDDDELDAASYVACPQMVYSSFFLPQTNRTPDGERLFFNNLVATN